jgi:hypothetical protein
MRNGQVDIFVAHDLSGKNMYIKLLAVTGVTRDDTPCCDKECSYGELALHLSTFLQSSILS